MKKEDWCGNCQGYTGFNYIGMTMAMASEGKEIHKCQCRQTTQGRIKADENKLEGYILTSNFACPNCTAHLSVRVEEKK